MSRYGDKTMESVKYPKEVIDSMNAEIAELKAIVVDTTTELEDMRFQFEAMKRVQKHNERYECAECLVLKSRLSARNTQIADLKHRLERAESVTSLLCKYGKDTERNKRLSLPHEIFVAIDKALEK